MSGFGMQDVKNIVRAVGGASALGISLAEFWNTDKNEDPVGFLVDEVMPSSVALTLTAFFGLTMLIMAIIVLVIRPADGFKSPWRKEAGKTQVYASALTFLASAFLVGVKSKATDSVGDVLQGLPGGMFLCLSLVKVLEYVFDTVEVFSPSDPQSMGYTLGENFDNLSVKDRLAEREQMSVVGFISVAFGITLSAISHWHYECKLEPVVNSTGNFTCDYDNSPTSIGDMSGVGVITAIVAASLAFVVQGFILGCIRMQDEVDFDGGFNRLRAHVFVGITIALVLYVSVAALAMSVGRDFSKEFYLKGFLASNYLYYAAILFIFFGVVQFEDFDGVHEKFEPGDEFRKLGTVAQLAGAVLLGAFCTAALWGSDLLFHKEIVGMAADADRRRVELGIYAIITVLILAGHTLLVKMIEVLLIPEFKICGCYPDLKSAKFEVATKRTEATLSLVLVSAVCFGHSESELSLTLLFVAACAARFVGYWQRYVPEKENPDEKVGERLCALIWDSDAKSLADPTLSKSIVFAMIALLFSHIFASAYVFRDGEPVPAGSDTLRYWELIMWILLTVHVVLTVQNLLVGLCNENYYFHAGAIPPLRFLVSSFVLVVFSISLGSHPFKEGLFPYTVPLVLSLVAYDSLSRGKF